MRKGTLISVAAIVAITFIVSACNSLTSNNEQNLHAGETPDPAGTKGEPILLTLRHTQVKDTQKKRFAMLQDVVKATESKVPGLSITLDGVEDKVNRFEKLRAEMAAGNPPEIFDLFGGTDTKDYVKAGRLLDLTPILNELGLINKFYSFEEFTVNGKIYGIPMAGYVEGLYYNKRILADHHIKPPQTWEELLAAAAILKAQRITPFAMAAKDSWVINMMSNTMWVRTAGPDSIQGLLDGSKRWTDLDVVDAFEKYHTLIQKGYLQEGSLALAYAEQQNKFSSGEAAFMFDGSWANTPLLDPEKSSIVKDVGFMSFPDMGGPGDGYINGGWSNAYGFSKKVTPDQLVAIKEFIRQMYNESMQKRQLVEEGMPPAMKLQDTSNVNPLITEILNVFASSKGAFPAFDSRIQTKVREKLERGMQELIGGRTDPATLMADIQKQQEASNKEETHTK
ncbi:MULTISPECIES: extracellular solute-binding protein [unclassified Paenibacillus]|uniref:extracellular solute-binding protein n=1 Tax=unclassified Paenibacillus TaxID=185978 RepID=UPI000709D85E|nr:MULTISPECIES: extracellular solute-binding protein [unclassified Paenibacillus]KQX48994.1 ABC transporter substrate-binding protein [Paenibacillus sp. Root444D2]KRE36610.1 ABC transporter substrate-binding protein [Paenibacillus sp. Soil724D2]